MDLDAECVATLRHWAANNPAVNENCGSLEAALREHLSQRVMLRGSVHVSHVVPATVDMVPRHQLYL